MKRSVEVVYTEYWVIRVVKNLDTRKVVTKEAEFATPPTEQDIVDVLVHCEPNEFVSVEHNYRLG